MCVDRGRDEVQRRGAKVVSQGRLKAILTQLSLCKHKCERVFQGIRKRCVTLDRSNKHDHSNLPSRVC